MSRTFNDIFMAQSQVIYPPFSKGILIEDFMNEYLKKRGMIGDRLFINVNWTNLFVNKTFKNVNFNENLLKEYLKKLDPSKKYFTVVQMDDGVLYELPPDTKIYGCCSGIPIPLVYKTDIFNNIPKKSFKDKKIFCSFVGSLTHQVRETMINILDRKKFIFMVKEWTPTLENNQLNVFINVTLDSKYVLAPRGYGRNSFRFWEALELKSIPIYIWDDIDFLPFKDDIDYSKLCININVCQLKDLEEMLNKISEEDYNNMLEYYQSIKHLYTYEGIAEKLIK